MGKEFDTVRVVHNPVIQTQRGVIPVAAVAEVPIDRDTFKISHECRHCHQQPSEKVPVVKQGKGAPTTGITPAWPRVI